MKKTLLVVVLLFFLSAGFLLFQRGLGFHLKKDSVKEEPCQELTFSMIKPSCVMDGHVGDILQKIEQSGFQIMALRMRTLSRKEAERFYKEHASKPFFPDLVEKMTSGPVVTMVLQKEGAVDKFRLVVGSTDPKKAAPHTIRSLYGKDISENGIHASDSLKSAQREIAFFFAEDELVQTENPSPK
jgi:nucleoside-diphosphate kinase